MARSTSRQRFFFNLGALAAAVLLMMVAAAFGPGAVEGVGLGIGIAACVISLSFIAALACVGLVAHEICTERVVHVLEVVGRPHRDRA